jgi:hypothetical protein
MKKGKQKYLRIAASLQLLSFRLNAPAHGFLNAVGKAFMET